MAYLIHSVLPTPRRPIIFISSNLKVVDCIRLMTERDIGALVVKDHEHLIGMVTERDIIRSCLALNLSQQETTAGDIAWKNVSILDVNDTVEKAMETITTTKRRHILIEENHQLVAILSIGDLLFRLLDDKARIIQHLENYIYSKAG